MLHIENSLKSSRRRRASLGIVPWAFLFVLQGCAHPPEFDEPITRTGTIERNLYAAGPTVRVHADVQGDVVAAGGTVIIDQRVSDDILAAGGSVDIAGEVGDDVRAAGGQVMVRARIAGEAVLAGGRVQLARESTVGERAMIAGDRVEIDGSLRQGLRARAGSIRIGGNITGDVDIIAGRVEVGPEAVITGTVRIQSPVQPVIAEGARIEGQVIYRPTEESPLPGIAIAGAIVAFFLTLLAMLVTGAVLLALFPRAPVEAARLVWTRPWASLGLGLSLVIVTPVAAVLMMATVVGIPLGISVLLLYPVFLLGASIVAALAVGDGFLRLIGRGGEPTWGWRFLAFAIGLLALFLLGLIPFLGALVLIFVFLFAAGALVLRVFGAWRSGARGREVHESQPLSERQMPKGEE
jgi:cytoskeletal protein CcmA (bactofilin family)